MKEGFLGSSVCRIACRRGWSKNQMSRDIENIQRRERLTKIAPVRRHFNPAYSRIIQKLQIAMPLIAAAIITFIFVWSGFNRYDLVTPQQNAKTSPEMAKNQLLNPRFESSDDKGQPYTLTARQALQGETDQQPMLLEQPRGEMLLNEGHKIAIEANNGEFTQDDRKLLLRGHVRLTHDGGYELKTDELHIDLQNSTASTKTAVQAGGPAGTLEAKGLQGSAKEGTLAFTGPAKLVLTQAGTAGGLKGLLPP